MTRSVNQIENLTINRYTVHPKLKHLISYCTYQNEKYVRGIAKTNIKHTDDTPLQGRIKILNHSYGNYIYESP